MTQVAYTSGLEAYNVPASAAKLDMNEADKIAVRITGLYRQMAGRTLVDRGDGVVTGNCRLTGDPLVKKGAGLLRTRTVSGRTGLSSGPSAQAGLAFGPGSMRTSYTAVVPMVMSALTVDSGGSYLTNPLSSMSDDATLVASMIRIQSDSGLINRGGDSVATGQATATPLPSAGVWRIIVVAYDNATRVAHASVDGTNFSTGTQSGSEPAGATDFVTMGLPTTPNALRECTIGDLYFFDRCLRTNSDDQAKLDQLVSALKGYYGI